MPFAGTPPVRAKQRGTNVKDGRQRFLDEHLPLPGIVACAVWFPDRSLITRRDGDALTTAQVGQLMNRLTLALDGFKRHRFEPEYLCWKFDHAHIHLTRHAEGDTLAVFSKSEPGQSANDAAWRLMQAYHELPVS